MNTPLWMCAAVAVAIFGVILHSVATFRTEGEPRTRYKRRALIEVVWALVPILIVIAAAVPSFREHAPTAVIVASE